MNDRRHDILVALGAPWWPAFYWLQLLDMGVISVEEKEAFERVKKVAVAQLNVNADEVTMEASFTKDLGADSLDTVELVMALEEEFGMEIPDEDAEKITTVGEAVKYIAQHV